MDESDMVKENVFTLPISIGSYKRFIEEIFYLAESKPSSYVCFANVHMTIEAYEDNQFNHVLKNADIVAPDGQPLSLFLTYLKRINQERVCGMDVFPDLLREAEARGKSIYFYGTTDEVLNKIAEKAKKEFPNLKICGLYSPPFRPLTQDEKKGIITQINQSKPDLVFVALGCPKQEKWMAEHKDKIQGCMLGLGQAFHTYAGTAKRSPAWMQRMSLEWAYRLYLEPGRLWKRYFYTNTYFLILTFKYFVNSVRVSFVTRTADKFH
jgi:N-acetylglucosaminyldiphosphoundecaprenol N-acetyl-beta-D-mannosaminyltransferase